MYRVEFTIAETLPTTNVLMRLHHRKVTRIRFRVAQLVAIALTGLRPAEPIKHCRIHVKRYSAQEPDVDAMPTTAKLLLDVLQPFSKRCPNGLGVIANDNSKCVVDLQVKHVPRRLARTDVIIQEVEE